MVWQNFGWKLLDYLIVVVSVIFALPFFLVLLSPFLGGL